MTSIVGSAAVSIVPSMQGFAEKIRAQLLPEADRIGQDFGAQIGRNARERLALEMRNLPDAHVNVDLDTGDAQAKLAVLDEEVKKVGRDARSAGSGFGFLSGGVNGASVATAALLPALPTLAGGLLAVGGAFASAGTAALSGGIVLAAGVAKAVEANKQLEAAQKAVDQATTKAGRNKALAEQSALIDKLGPSTIAFGQALKSVGDVGSAFAQSFIPQEVQLVAGFERLEKDILPALKPLVSNTFGVFGAEIDKLDAAVNSKGGQSFFSWLAVEGPRDLEKISDGLGNFAAGFGHLTEASTPLIHQLVDGFDDIGASFNRWSQGLGGNSGFQHFLTVVETDGPILVHTLGDVASAIGRIGIATSPILPVLLRFVDSIATLINDHPGIAASLGAMFLGFQALKIVGSLISPLQLAGGALGLIGLNARGAAGEVAGLRSGLLGLSSIGPIAIPIVLGITAKAGVDVTADALNKAGNGRGGGGSNSGFFGGGSFLGDALRTVEHGLDFSNPGYASDVTSVAEDIVGKPFAYSTGAPVSAANIASTYNSQVPKFSASPSGPGLLGGFAGLAKTVGSIGAAVAGNPDVSTLASFYNPLTGGASSAALPLTGGGSKAAATAAQNNAAALAYLMGVSIPASLAQGIASGTNPLTQTFQNLNQKLTGTAQTLANSLESAFSAVLQYGQQASASLIPNLTSGLPQLGSMTNVTVGPDGKLVTTQASPILGGLQLTLGNDKRFAADVDKARKLGLSQTLLSQFVQAGPSSLDQLDALVNGSPGDIKAINATFGQITSLGNQFGAQQATAQGQAQTNQLLQQLIAAVAAQAPQLASALNGASAAGARKAAASISLGPFGR